MTITRTAREQEIYAGNARRGTAASTKNAAVRLITDWQFAKRIVRYALGLPVPMETEDRRILEQVIFPYFLTIADIRAVLFVGCDWYTKHYAEFFRDRTFVTIDPATRAKRFGARRHIVAPLEELDNYVDRAYFDLIICNGVYGFGLDAGAQCERAFAACHSRLREGGYFVLGWDDIRERTPVPLSDIKSLDRFRPWVFPPLGTWRYTTDTLYRHTYDFYRT